MLAIDIDIRTADRARQIFVDGLRKVGRADPDHVDVFVPSGSPANEYAGKMHDEKGSSWQKRGPGTVAKGAQADDEFISRAATMKAASTKRQFERALAVALEHPGPAWARGALRNIGLTVTGQAKQNAPRSMSRAQYLQTLKTARGRANSVAQLHPGGLQNSLTFEVG